MDFADSPCREIYTYLLKTHETSFRVMMPKMLLAPKDARIEIATEYYDALYFGQKLSEFSADFCYQVPSACSETPFAYEFSTTDMEKLADSLFYLIRGIVLDEETDYIMEKYWEEKEQFWEQYCNNQIEPVCHGLLHIMEDMLSP